MLHTTAFFYTLLLSSFLFSTNSQAKTPRGEAMFKLCQACHGEMGEGKENLKAPSIAGLPAWYIERQLKNFRAGARGKHPKDIPGLRMRPMARTIPTEQDVTDVALFVSKMKPVATARTVKGNALKGEGGFQTCQACHGAKAEGNKILNAPPLAISDDWYLLTQLKNFKHGVRGGDATKDPNGATMKGIAGILDEQAMIDVVTYIQTIK